MSGYFWVVLGGLVIFTTKYLTSVRLRGLTDRMRASKPTRWNCDMSCVLAEEKETQLKTETERLQTKVSGLRNVVATLERSLQRFRPT